MTYWKTNDGTGTAGNGFDLSAAEHLIGLWDFNDGAKTADTGLTDGFAQNGHLHGGASISDGALRLDGLLDYFDVSGATVPFDLATGTVMVQFTPGLHVGLSPNTVVSRGEYCDRASEGYFGIQVTAAGQVQLQHYDNGTSVTLATEAGFFAPGDELRIAYTWDAASSGTLVVENITTGESTALGHDVVGLSMDISDKDNENFTFGAREVDDAQYDQYFRGQIDYVAVFDANIVASSDGIVSGTGDDDLIDVAYAGDPDGDMVDAGDAVRVGDAGDDDLIQAGAGNDTVNAGLGNDEIYGDSGTGTPITVRESFNWSDLDDTDRFGYGTVDDGESLDGDTLVQSTGNVTVTVVAPASPLDSEFDTRTISVAGIDGGDESVDANSSLYSAAQAGESDAYEISFSAPVQDVSFNVADIDADLGQVTVYAFDADGNKIPVALTAGSDLVLSDMDGVNGVDTATTTNSDNVAPTEASNTVTVAIAGPVARIEIVHTSAGSGTSGINVSDIFFDAIIGVAEGAGDDVLAGELGDDLVYGQGGDDTILLADDFGADTIVGGETAESDGDTLDATAVTEDTTLVFTNNPESGTIANGADTARFSEIENVMLGSGDDDVTGGTGNDQVDLGQGRDVANLGAGNDTVSLGQGSDGSPDGDADLLVFSDGDGDDTVQDFDAPVVNADGSVTGIDMLDVTNLHNAGGDPVDTDDVTVAADGSGNAVLTFPNGENLTLVGVPVAALDTPDKLHAIGIPLPLDGIVSGTDGDDLIDLAYTGDPDGDMVDAGDAVLPGQGPDDDIIVAGAGSDTVYAGFGDDDVTTGDGSDSVFGEDGNDVINTAGSDPRIDAQLSPLDTPDATPDDDRDYVDGGAGNDIIHTGDDRDTIFGGDGADLIFAGIDDDWIDGGDGNDIITAGQGDDTIIGGLGADLMDGGLGDDLFTGLSAGDVIIGGEDVDGNDVDTLDLSGLGAVRVTYDPIDSESGIVEFLDGEDGAVTGALSFHQIENVVPCFTPGTLIATPKGERPVEELRAGDKVITRDNGIQEIRWVGAKEMDWKALAANPHLKPILIKAGTLGDGLPERDMMVSPNHRMLVANDRTALYFEEREVLAAAKHLINHQGIMQAQVMRTTYIHFMFDQHEVVLSDGAWTESFQPGDYTLNGIGNAQRVEILELFPELATVEGIKGYTTARRALKKHEAMLLVE